MKLLSRKLKKKVKQIPVGSYCYGDSIGNGVGVGSKRGTCLFYHTANGGKTAYCSFLHKVDDFELLDQTKICGSWEDYFDLKTGKVAKKNFVVIDRLPLMEQQPFRDWLVGQPNWRKPSKGKPQIALRAYYDMWLTRNQ